MRLLSLRLVPVTARVGRGRRPAPRTEGLLSLSIVHLWHGTFDITALSHAPGTRRYDTDDDRNSGLLALLMLGEGWHNTQHQHR